MNAHEPNCTPLSEWMIVPAPPARPSLVAMAMPSAFVTSVAVGDASIDQPTTRRE
ncbi:hypothetical protein [Demequina sp.]|uniref:hypothetical protein n=1 Tax=Demequina sp. TaxID=2050685 RepID=UPI003A8B64B5